MSLVKATYTRKKMLPDDMTLQALVVRDITSIAEDLTVPLAKSLAPIGKTGRLRKNIRLGSVGIIQGMPQVTIVAKAPGALSVEQGTGVYVGESPIRMVPRNKTILRSAQGWFAHETEVQGQRPQHYLRNALRRSLKFYTMAIARIYSGRH